MIDEIESSSSSGATTPSETTHHHLLVVNSEDNGESHSNNSSSKRRTERFSIHQVLEQFSLEDSFTLMREEETPNPLIAITTMHDDDEDGLEVLSTETATTEDETSSQKEETTEQMAISEQLILACLSEEHDDTACSQLISSLLTAVTQLTTTTTTTTLNHNNNNNNINNKPLLLDNIRHGKANSTLMHLVAQKNKVLCMEVLLQHGASIDSLDAISATPLFYSCAHNCAETTTFLLHHGANVNAKDGYHNFPLLIALKNRFFNICDILILFHANIHLRMGTRGSCLHIVAENGNIDAVKYLIDKCGASPFRLNDCEENLLFCSLAFTRMIRYLMEKFSIRKLVLCSNLRKSNVFHECCYHGYFDALLTILGFCMSSEDITDANMSDILNEKDLNGKTPLMVAVSSSKHKIIRFLCLCKAVDIDVKDNDGNTALHHSIMKKDLESVAILVSVGGASRRSKNKQRVTCVQLAQQLNVVLPADMKGGEVEEEGGELSFADLMREDIVLEHFENPKPVETIKLAKPKSPRSPNPLTRPDLEVDDPGELSFEELMKEEFSCGEEPNRTGNQKKSSFNIKALARMLYTKTQAPTGRFAPKDIKSS